MKTACQLVIGALALLCAAVQAQAPSAAAEPPVPESRRLARELLWWGDFAALEREHARWWRSPERSPNGQLQLSQFRVGLADVLGGYKGDGEAYHRQLVELTRGWTVRHPRSPLAHVLHARALSSLAWWYRGSGYRNTVPPQAWQQFQALLEEAAQHLQRHADVAFEDSSAHNELIGIGLGLGWDPDRVWALARQGLQKNRHDHHLYETMLESLLPKWGGSAQAVDRFIVMATEATRAERGEEMYARLYSLATHAQFESELFTETGVDWVRMQRGFRDWITRWPQAEFVNRFAYMACLARDKAVFLEQLQKIGSKPQLNQWGSRGQQAFTTCKRWGEAS